MSYFSKNTVEKDIYDELIKIFVFENYHEETISAAGFFKVETSTLFGIFIGITSFSAVLVQFNRL